MEPRYLKLYARDKVSCHRLKNRLHSFRKGLKLQAPTMYLEPRRMPRWDTLERLAKKAADLKNEFDAAEESNRPDALLRWNEALDYLTDALLYGKVLPEI